MARPAIGDYTLQYSYKTIFKARHTPLMAQIHQSVAAAVRAPAATERPIAVDLFSGCGGLTLGIKQAGFRVAAAVEIDPSAASCYRANHPNVRLFERDIRTVSVDDLRESFEGQLSLVAGCPPCQGFSRIRTRNAPRASSDPQNSLYLEFLRIVKGLKPKAIMLENVPLFGGGQRFQRLCRELRQSGYMLFHDVIDTADFGVPQRRSRLILLGLLGDAAPNPAPPIKERKTVAESLASLSPEFLANDALHNLPQKFSEQVLRRIRAIPRNGGSRGSLPPAQALNCHRHRDGQRNGFFDVYGRMRWDDVAPTITAGVYTPSKGRFLHPDDDRCISLREAAVFQSFPQSYKFPVALGKIRLAWVIGNAIPPEFVRHHAVALRRALATI